MAHNREKTAAFLMLLLLILGLVPIIWLGRYNHPTGDDYYYGAETHRIWEETHSVPATVKGAVQGAAYDYQTWQGTYSAMVLMRLQPTVFSETAYQWVTCVIVMLLVGGIFYLGYSVLCIWLQGSVWSYMAIAAAISLLAVETVPTPAESMFWYNGSMYYTGYLAATLFLWGMLLRYLKRPRSYMVPVMQLFALFLAGGNYISLLPCMILLVLVTAVLIWKKEKRRAWGIGLVTTAILAGFFVNAMAPGNAVRQGDMWKIPAWKAIFKSLLQGVRYMDAWIGKWWLITALLITPFLWKSYQRTSFRFRYPAVALGLLYGIFCSMSCPTFYTMNSTGPARAVAVCYYGFLLFSFAGYAYLVGYFYQRYHKELPYGIMSLLFLGLLFMQVVSGSLGVCTSVESLRLLWNGEARSYQEEYQSRLQILRDETVENAVLEPYVHRPGLLYVGDLGADAQAPANQKVALFYGKKSVVVYCAENGNVLESN